VYPDDAFAMWLNQNFIVARLDVTKEATLGKKYGVAWTPWLLVVDENGDTVAQTVGPLSASDYQGWLDSAQMGHAGFQDTLKMLSVTPDNADMNMILGKAYFQAGNWAKAVEHLTVAMKGLGPDRAETCNEVCSLLGRAAVRKGDETAAKVATDCLAKCKGSDAAVTLERTHVKLASGDAAGAQKEYEAFVKDHASDPCAPEAWYWLGVSSYLASHKPEGLMDAWQKLIAAAPDNEWAKRASMTVAK